MFQIPKSYVLLLQNWFAVVSIITRVVHCLLKQIMFRRLYYSYTVLIEIHKS